MSPKNQDQAAYTNLDQFKSGYNYLSHVPDCQDLDDKLGEYNGHEEVQMLENPEQVSGDPELPGFRLLMEKIW
jgi:hypothetical protein